MNILKLIIRQKKEKKVIDIYQEAVNKIGREQLKKLLASGLRVPVAIGV